MREWCSNLLALSDRHAGAVDQLCPLRQTRQLPNNATFADILSFRSEKTVDSLRSLSSPSALVLRNGDPGTKSIPSGPVVPGDVVELRVGDIVPADVRLFEAYNFAALEAILTGEPIPVIKEIEAISGEQGVGDRINMAFSGTEVTKGELGWHLD